MANTEYIRVSKEVKDRLERRKIIKKEPVGDVIGRVLDVADSIEGKKYVPQGRGRMIK